MSSDTGDLRKLELIPYRGAEESFRIKRRTKSERRRRERTRPKQRTSPKERRTRSSFSEDSGAGGEDEGSASQESADDKVESGRRKRHVGGDPADKRNPRQVRSGHQSGKSRSGETTPISNIATTANTEITSERRPQKAYLKSQTPRHNATSDSAISTSVVSTSAISTSAESPFVSSPNLSDNSKTPSSSRTRPRSPELSRALRRKQERLKRQLDLRETRARLEKLRFTEKAYQSQRMMFMTSSLSRRRHAPKSAGSASSSQRARSPNPNTQSYPVGKESRRLSSRGRSPQTDASLALNNDHDSTVYGKALDLNTVVRSPSPAERLSPVKRLSRTGEDAKQNARDSKSLDETTSASVDRLESSTPSGADNPGQPSSSKRDHVSSSTPSSSSNPHTNPVDPKRPETSSEAPGGQKSKHKSSSRREGSSKRRHRDASSRDRRQPDDAPDATTLTVPKIQTSEGDQLTPSSPRSEDDFDKVAKRLETSPRVNPSSADQVETRMSHAMDAILRDGMLDMPSVDEITEKGLMDWRAVFRVEMMRLRREVNEFRMFCHQQIELHALGLEKAWNNNNNNNNINNNNNNNSDSNSVKAQNDIKATEPEPRRSEAPKVTEQLKDLEVNMKLFQRKQVLLDQETELLEKEERLSEKVKHLEEYEKEILEVESMLNQRQAICDRRQRALVNLDEELQALRQELEETKDHINSDGSIPESNSEKARKNWDMVRRNLMDKQHLLETTVQKYRSELAAATSTIAGKDILISRLQSVAMHHEEELASRDKRIQQLSSKLTIALAETRNLTDQLSGSSHRDSVSVFGRGDTESHAPSSHRRPSHDANATDSLRSSFRSSSAYYRRPSSNAGSEQGEDYVTKAPNGTVGGGGDGSVGFGGESSRAASARMSRKRNSVSDNAISRLTLSTPRSDDKFGRGSSACTVQ